MKWNSALYDEAQSFVSTYGKNLISRVTPQDNQQIFDLGCGTGDLTHELTELSDHVLGIDSSEDMIEAARRKYPHVDFAVMDACSLPWKNTFDVVFSNAVFHWIADQGRLLNNIHTALKDGGRLISEFGASGNITHIEATYRAVVPTYDSPFYFPTVDEYARLLKSHGFSIETLYDYERPTALPSGSAGLRTWMTQFFATDLMTHDSGERQEIIAAVERRLAPELFDGAQWVADYRRIRVLATR